MADQGGRRGARAVGATAGLALLGAQVAAVVYAHAVQPADRDGALRRAWNGCSVDPESCTRYFAWAPNDYLVRFELSVRTPERTLGDEEARRRYLLGGGPRSEGRWEFPVQHLQDIIRQYETAYADETVEVTLRYTINDREWRTWRWRG